MKTLTNNTGLHAQELLQALGEATMRNGEIWRAIYTEEQKIGKELIESWMLERGFKCREDAIGNLIGRIEGESEETILIGSHMDTVKNGGLYDGAAGIVLGILSVSALVKEMPLKKSIEVIAFVEEEASRFLSGYLGSKHVCGRLSNLELEDRDETGQTLRAVMKAHGGDPHQLDSKMREQLKYYLEVHIEQGRVLESQNAHIGVVEQIVGVYAYHICIEGQQDHAGTTPMTLRKDAVFETCQWISELTHEVKEMSSTATFTVGQFNVQPGISNVIAKKVSLTIDLRDGSLQMLDQIENRIYESLNHLENEGMKISIKKNCDEKPVGMDEKVTALIEESAKNLKLKTIRMNSGAGHDAQIMAESLPSGLIFIPSVNGRSHCPEEYTKPEDLEQGMKVLKGVLKKLVGE